MVEYFDSFNRSNTTNAQGLGTIPGGPNWTSLSGLWRILNNSAHSDTSNVQNPIAVVNLGSQDVSIQVNINASGGGDALYARVVNSSNWWRIRYASWSGSTPTYTTEYEWTRIYNGSSPGSLTEFPPPYPQTVSHTHSLAQSPSLTLWGTSATISPSFPNSASHTHLLYDEHSWPFVMTQFHTSNRAPTLTGNTRQVQSGSTNTTSYAVYLERCINGTVTTVASSNGQTNRIRLDLNGNQISAFKGTSTTPWFTTNDPVHNTATSHGIGRGPSERTGSQLQNFRIQLFNQPPFSPSPVWPRFNQVVNANTSNDFQWNFRDPDPGDTPTAFRLQYQLIGGTTHTVEQQSTSSFWRAVAGTFTIGQHRWRVQTTDTGGLTGEYSDWEFFNVTVPPDQAIIEEPSNNAVISTSSITVRWSTPEQQAWRVRVVGETNEQPDVTRVYYDSNAVSNPNTRSLNVNFPDNNVTRFIQVQIQRNGLWSTWASVRVEVSFAPPPKPNLMLEPQTEFGGVRVICINPPPGTGVPHVVTNNVYRRTDRTNWAKVGEAMPNGAFFDYAVGSRTDYDYMAEAVAHTGATSESDSYLINIRYNKWFLKDVRYIDDVSDHIDLFVDGSSDMNIESHEDQAEFGPLGRSHNFIVRDVVRGDKFTLKIQVMGEEERRALENMRERQSTYLLQSPFQQWYVVIGKDVTRNVQNSVDDYEIFDIPFIEQRDPFDV